MRSFTFCLLSDEEYASFWEASPQRNFLNSPEAAALRRKENWQVELPAVRENGRIVCASLLASSTVMKIYRYYYGQRGFLVDYSDQELLAFYVEHLKEYLHAHKGLYLMINPYVLYRERDISGDLVPDGFDHSYVISNLEKLGFIHQPFINYYDGGEPQWMFSMNLEGRDEAGVLKNMAQQTRWSVRRTEKTGIQVRKLTRDEMNIFIEMEKETGKRRNFAIRDTEFYCRQADAYGAHEKVLAAYLDIESYLKNLSDARRDMEKEKAEIDQVLTEHPSRKYQKRQRVLREAIDLNENNRKDAQHLQAKYGRIIYMAASVFMVYSNEITYLFSATHDEFRKFYAPYAIQWYIIRYAIKHHIPRYNFYGISGNFDKSAADYGIYTFKKGFGGQVEQLVGKFILPIRPAVYKMYTKLKK
jgi:peptidoglycan pentaglycine glycine transferase (the second and third glycine)